MADSTFDCYLCGTANPASADFCVRCSGQLLKVNDAPQDDAAEASDGLADSFGLEVKQEPNPPAKQSRKVHASIEDQRLSDALGLTEDVEEIDTQPDRAPITGSGAIPQQPSGSTSTSLPTINPNNSTDPAVVKPVQVTRPDADPRGNIFTSRGDEEVGPIAWVIVAMLFMAVGWFGYSTIFSESERLTPESIGFVAETTTLPPTTTIAPEEIRATAGDVDSDYNSSLVRLVPFQCVDGQGDQNGEPLVGVSINRHTVLVGPGLPAGTNAIRIVTRTGATRVAILSQLAGATLATSNAQTSRNLEIEEIGTETSFYVHYDLEENEVFVTETSQDVGLEIEVSDTSAVHQIRVGDVTISAEQLASVDLTVGIDEENTRRGNSTCNLTAGFVFASPEVEPAEETENE